MRVTRGKVLPILFKARVWEKQEEKQEKPLMRERDRGKIIAKSFILRRVNDRFFKIKRVSATSNSPEQSSII